MKRKNNATPIAVINKIARYLNKISKHCSTSAIILAGGKSVRMDNVSKQLIDICGKPVIIHSALAFEKCDEISEIIIVCSPQEQPIIEKQIQKHKITKFKGFAVGGETRFDSSKNGFLAVDPKAELVAIHDAARCLITPESICNVIKAAKKYGGAIAATPSIDTVKIVDETGLIKTTVDRKTVWNAQTPQVFIRPMIEVGLFYEREKDFVPTDDSMLVETLGFKVCPVDCGKDNIKITYPSDVKFAQTIISCRKGD